MGQVRYKKGTIKHAHHGEEAWDFFNRYRADIYLMKTMSIPNFRFSLSWPRILPNGTGKVNEEGIDFYNRVIDFCLECNITPYCNKDKDIKAAQKADALLNRLFLEPSLGLGYPTDVVPILKQLKKYQKPEDEKNCVFNFDFIGIQNYTREVVKHSYFVPYLWAKIIKAHKRNVQVTQMDWEVFPPSIYAMISQFIKYKKNQKETYY